MSSEDNFIKSGIDTIKILTIIFVALKVLGLIQWSWLWVLSPIWIIGILAIINSIFKDI